MNRSAESDRPLIGWVAVGIGIAAIVAALAGTSTGVGRGFVFGFGAFIVFFGLLSVGVRDRRPDFWALVVVGLAMVTVPFLGNGYAADRGASWACWIAGGLAMVLGGVGWLRSSPSTEYGINEIGDASSKRSVRSYWMGRAALVVALAAVLAGIAVRTTAPGTAVTIGLGGSAAVIAVWSLLAVDPTRDFLTLAVTGFALLLSRWVTGFAGDSAAWTALVPGAVITALGAVGYLRGERLDFGSKVEGDAATRYRQRFGRR